MSEHCVGPTATGGIAQEPQALCDWHLKAKLGLHKGSGDRKKHCCCRFKYPGHHVNIVQTTKCKAKYVFTRTASQSPVDQVETKLREHLDRQGLGAPLETRPTVAQVLQSITKCQGGKVEGTGTLESLLQGIADKVQGMVADLGRGVGAAGGASAGAFGTSELRIALLEQQLRDRDRQLSSAHEQMTELLRRLELDSVRPV